MMDEIQCPRCDGSGLWYGERSKRGRPCLRCNGLGRVPKRVGPKPINRAYVISELEEVGNAAWDAVAWEGGETVDVLALIEDRHGADMDDWSNEIIFLLTTLNHAALTTSKAPLHETPEGEVKNLLIQALKEARQ